ncbi:hypothetical protein ABIA24_000770 [Sinorhizobium fredii]
MPAEVLFEHGNGRLVIAAPFRRISFFAARKKG